MYKSLDPLCASRSTFRLHDDDNNDDDDDINDLYRRLFIFGWGNVRLFERSWIVGHLSRNFFAHMSAQTI